jgi:hypothetical protein
VKSRLRGGVRNAILIAAVSLAPTFTCAQSLGGTGWALAIFAIPFIFVWPFAAAFGLVRMVHGWLVGIVRGRWVMAFCVTGVGGLAGIAQWWVEKPNDKIIGIGFWAIVFNILIWWITEQIRRDAPKPVRRPLRKPARP